MSDFRCDVMHVAAIEAIEGADRIELAVVGEYRSIVAKGAYNVGDLVVYLPEGAVLPDWLIKKIGLEGKLSGNQKNRIKAVKLRGCLSQGILYPVEASRLGDMGLEFGNIVRGAGDLLAELVTEGDDVAEFLGVKKWDPTEAMDASQRKRFHGSCVYIPGKTMKYDFENWKKYPYIFAEGDEVVITEKLHGTMCCFASYPGLGHPDLRNDEFVYSKGLGAGGQVFKWSEENEGNLYLRALDELERLSALAGEPVSILKTLRWAIKDRFLTNLSGLDPETMPIFLFGEVYGTGVQDLGYGTKGPEYRAFDIYVGEPNKGRFIDAYEKYFLLNDAGIPYVPVLYTGLFSRDIMLALTDGKTTLGNGHVREGVVITSLKEENVHRFGRKILKSVSGDYLTRKGNITEFN